MKINALGPLVIEVGGIVLRKAPKKARALLVYLAMQDGAPVSRAKIADLLWPYQQSEQALHSLRNCLLELRKALGRAVVHLVTDFVHCRLSGAVTDVDHLKQLARSPQTGDLTAAAELYRGDLLDGLVIASEPFEEWLAWERDRARICVREVLEQLVIRHIDGDFHAAIAAGRRLVQLDPLCERGHRSMMLAYAASGQRGDAMRQYRSCTEILDRELGVSPDHETKGLAANLFGEAAVIIRPEKATKLETIFRPAAEPTRDHDLLLGKLGRLENAIRDGIGGKRPFTRSLMIATAEALFKARSALAGADIGDPGRIDALASENFADMKRP